MCVWIALLSMSVPRARAADEPPLKVQLEVPAAGQPSGAEGSLGFVSGRVFAADERPKLDLIFLLDVSGSTQDSSGIDVDGDGEVSGSGKLMSRLFGGSSGGDSILAAELAAVRALLARLDSRTTRVGVVIFSGDGGGQDALVEVPLTDDYRQVERGLDEIALVPPAGGTNMYAGLRLAALELSGGSSAVSPRRKGAQRYILLLTDGEPTLPAQSGRREPVARVLKISRSIAKRGIKIDSFAIGARATQRPEAPREASSLTGGTYVAVDEIAELANRVEGVRFVDVAGLEIRNRTLDAPAACQLLEPDGRFSALIPMKPGANDLLLVARSTTGKEARHERELRFESDAPLESQLDERQRVDLLRLRALCTQNERRLEIESGEDASRRRLEIEPEPERKP